MINSKALQNGWELARLEAAPLAHTDCCGSAACYALTSGGCVSLQREL